MGESFERAEAWADQWLAVRGLTLQPGTSRYLAELLRRGAGTELRGEARGKTFARALYYIMHDCDSRFLTTHKVERPAVLHQTKALLALPRKVVPPSPGDQP